MSEHKFDPPTVILSNRLYDMADIGSTKQMLLSQCAERLDAQTVVINGQAAQIEALRTGDPCGRSCEGQAYRIEARTEKARADELERKVVELSRLISEAEEMTINFPTGESFKLKVLSSESVDS